MSYSSDLLIKYSKRSVSNVALIGFFLRSGWTLDNGVGMIEYLPLGDPADIETAYAPAGEQASVLEALERKEDAQQALLVALTWNPEGVGGTFIFSPQDEMSISFYRGRRTLITCDPFTDYSWYLPKIVSPLHSAGLTVGMIKWTDVP